jgi:hypothetical protein
MSFWDVGKSLIPKQWRKPLKQFIKVVTPVYLKPFIRPLKHFLKATPVPVFTPPPQRSTTRNSVTPKRPTQAATTYHPPATHSRPQRSTKKTTPKLHQPLATNKQLVDNAFALLKKRGINFRPTKLPQQQQLKPIGFQIPLVSTKNNPIGGGLNKAIAWANNWVVGPLSFRWDKARQEVPGSAPVQNIAAMPQHKGKFYNEQGTNLTNTKTALNNWLHSPNLAKKAVGFVYHQAGRATNAANKWVTNTKYRKNSLEARVAPALNTVK